LIGFKEAQGHIHQGAESNEDQALYSGDSRAVELQRIR